MNILGNITEILIIMILIISILIIILFILFLIQKRKINSLENRIYDLSAGSNGESLENTLIKILDNYEGINNQLKENTEDIKDIYKRLHKVIQKIGVIKYDAFNQMGGNLSSVVVLLNQDNDGVIINTVQNIDSCYSYVKEVRKGKSEVAYTEEEQEAIEIALMPKKSNKISIRTNENKKTKQR